MSKKQRINDKAYLAEARAARAEARAEARTAREARAAEETRPARVAKVRTRVEEARARVNEAREMAAEALSWQATSWWAMEEARAARAATAMGAPRISLATTWEGAAPASMAAVAMAEAAMAEREEDAALHGYFNRRNQLADLQRAAKDQAARAELRAWAMASTALASAGPSALCVTSDKQQAADKRASEARADVARLAAMEMEEARADVGWTALKAAREARQDFSGGHYKFKHYGKTKRRYNKTKRRYGKTKRRP